MRRELIVNVGKEKERVRTSPRGDGKARPPILTTVKYSIIIDEVKNVQQCSPEPLPFIQLKTECYEKMGAIGMHTVYV